MELPIYLAYVLASAVLIAVPGPNVTLIVANGVAHGRACGLTTVAGTSSAMVIQLVVACGGLGWLLGGAAAAFEVLRWAGVAYLAWLAVAQWRAGERAAAGAPAPAPPSPRRAFWQGFAVSATNPKTLVFYAAFLPQFVDPAHPAGPQLALLAVTFLVLAVLIDGGYAIAGARLGGWIAADRFARLKARVSAVLLAGAGLGLALARRQA